MKGRPGASDKGPAEVRKERGLPRSWLEPAKVEELGTVKRATWQQLWL